MALLLVAPVPPAAAEFGIAPEGFAVRLLDAAGNPELRAGSHPDRLQIDFELEVEGTSTRDLAIELPPGFGGNPAAVPACQRQAHEEGEECSPESQVGTVSFGASETLLPIFLLEPEAGQVAAFTSRADLPIPFELKLRPDDFGATFVAEDLAEGAPSEGHIELWGVPADHQGGTEAARQPFLTTPSVCGPLSFTLRARSREAGAPWLSADAATGPLVGCEGLAFSPRLDLRLSNPVADSPTGMQMALTMPEEIEGEELASAQMKDVSVALPPGIAVSPGGAVGLATCSDAQLALGSDAEPSCPAAARVGTVEFSSIALAEPLSGTIYLGAQRGDERFRLFIVAPGPGIVFKFVAALRPDPATGRLSATLRDLPQVAIGRIAMNLEGGPAGLLAAPLRCGIATGVALFVPYGDGPPVASSSSTSIASALPGLPCQGLLPFAPRLLVSASNHRAGRTTSFSATLQRSGGEGLPARFALTLPAGLSAALGSFDPCPEPQAGNGGCPARSRVGSVRAALGSGPSPAILAGAAYLAGPYRGAPFSLAIALPAIVGPFDLGTVVFRAAARIDTSSGRVTVATDPLPSVVEGVPIRFQAIELGLDRPGLVRNPTSCGRHAFDAMLESEEGVSTTLSSPYRVSGCKRLGFAPRVRVGLDGGDARPGRGGVGLGISARFRRNDASLRSLALTLPAALKLRISGVDEICSRTDARRSLCPPGSRVGIARARTPLLDDVLRGSVFVVQPRGDGEPDLWVELSSGGLELSIRGTGAREDGRFSTRLGGLPDMPLSKFTMRLGAGQKLLALEGGICKRGRPRRLHAEMLATAQNGARRSSRLRIATGARCGSALPR